MNLIDLRARHPKLIYQSYSSTIQSQNLLLEFRFHLEPNLDFTPKLVIPIESQPNLEELKPFIFHLGLMELISYWKCACPSVIEIQAGHLSSDQIEWWHDLFLHGLGEFFYRNQIDFTSSDFLTIQALKKHVILERDLAPSQVEAIESHRRLADQRDPIVSMNPSGLQDDVDNGVLNQVQERNSHSLFLIGGGKDSVVGLERLKQLQEPSGILLLNPTPASKAIAQTFLGPTIEVHRTIDPKLLELNQASYLNGHTPFSAYLSFLSVFISHLYGFQSAIVANESSANQANITYHGLEVNHQYSKTIRYESRFRDYCRQFLTDQVEYFSLLRPLTELQIAQLFAQTSTYDILFTSCNVSRGQGWCGHCPKCAFVYLCLFPFLSSARLQSIFKMDLFEHVEIQQHIRDLVGQGNLKPFECVGTVEESVQAVILTKEKYHQEGREVPEFLIKIEAQIPAGLKATPDTIRKHLKEDWDSNHFLPIEYEEIIKPEKIM